MTDNGAALSQTEAAQHGTALAETTPDRLTEVDDLTLHIGDEEIPIRSVEVEEFDFGGRDAVGTTFEWEAGSDTTDTEILEDAAETVYQRPEKHGDPEDSFDAIATLWEAYEEAKVTHRAEDEPRTTEVDTVCRMILFKIARVITGHYNADNWEDIAGYAENGARIERKRSFSCDECGKQRGLLPADNYCTGCGAALASGGDD